MAEREKLAETVKKALLKLFYALQGIGSLTVGLLFLISPGGRPYGIGIIFGAPLVFASFFSLSAAWSLSSGREDSAPSLGTTSSFLFILYFGWWIAISYYSIVEGDYDYVISLLLSVLFVVLNALAIFLLYVGTKKK